jgi:hypothetical protein
MIEFLQRIDNSLLLRINHFNAPWLDQCMWVLSSKWINFPLAFCIVLLLKSQFSWKKTSILFLLALVVVSLTDVISTQLFKDLFERLLALQLKYNIPLQDVYEIFKTLWVLSWALLALHWRGRWGTLRCHSCYFPTLCTSQRT